MASMDRRTFWVAGIAWLLDATVGAEVALGGPSLSSAVTFGTVCARCHEGECSGRLTFDLGADAAFDHVRRHAGDLPEASVRELVVLLEAMKTECVHPTVDAPVPKDRHWTKRDLEPLCTVRRTDCLVPLGILQPGIWRIELGLGDGVHVHAEVVTRRFETLSDGPLDVRDGRSTIRFRVSSASEPFLRLGAAEPIGLKGLRLERLEPPR